MGCWLYLRSISSVKVMRESLSTAYLGLIIGTHVSENDRKAVASAFAKCLGGHVSTPRLRRTTAQRASRSLSNSNSPRLFHATVCRQFLAGSFYGSSGDTSAIIAVFDGYTGADRLKNIRSNVLKKIRRVETGDKVRQSTHVCCSMITNQR